MGPRSEPHIYPVISTLLCRSLMKLTDHGVVFVAAGRVYAGLDATTICVHVILSNFI